VFTYVHIFIRKQYEYMYVCMYMFMYICMHMYICLCACMYIYDCMHTFIQCVCLHISMHEELCVCMYVRMHMGMYASPRTTYASMYSNLFHFVAPSVCHVDVTFPYDGSLVLSELWKGQGRLLGACTTAAVDCRG
jgi:hypothetical protein